MPFQFPSAAELLVFLRKAGVSPQQLDLDPDTGHALANNDRYSILGEGSSLKLSGHGVELLKAATTVSLDRLVQLASSAGARGGKTHDVEEPFGSARLSQSTNEVSLLLEKADFISRFIRARYGHTTEAIFSLVVSDLRQTPPWTSAEPATPLPAGECLQYFLLSLIRDRKALSHLADQCGAGILGAAESALCITDETRTRKFLARVSEAVQEQRALNPTSTLSAIDAGCGSVPILAIQAALADRNLVVTALELNPLSAEMARQVIKGFGLESRITVVEADATKYVPRQRAHVIVSETLQAGLGGEPVVQILQHLKQYLSEGGALIPDGVELSCGLLPLGGEPLGYMQSPYGTIPAISPKWIERREYKMGEPLDSIDFDIDISNKAEPDDMAVVGIRVRLGSHTLEQHESVITFPRPVLCAAQATNPQELVVESRAPRRLRVRYAPGGIPKGSLN